MQKTFDSATEDNHDWGQLFSAAWGMFIFPPRAIQTAMPIPAEATPVDLATAWRAAVAESDVPTIVSGLRESLQDTAESALRELHRRIAALPTSSQEGQLILTKDFGGQSLPTLEYPQPEEFNGPRTKVVAVAPLNRLPDGHFLRSVFPAEVCWHDSTDGPCLILGPTIRGQEHARSFYLLESIAAHTRAYRDYQLALRRKREANERLQADLERQAKEANSLYRAKKLEAENEELRQRLEALEQRLSQPVPVSGN